MGIMRAVTFFCTLALTSFGGAMTCSKGCERQPGEHTGTREMPTRSIQEVLAAHTDAWMAIPGVVGMGIGEFEGQPCIKVFLAGRTPGLAEKFPSALEGYRVILEVTGQFRALDPE